MVANLTYDFQGNLASKGPSGAVQNYTFDLGNRLRSVPNKETGYEYDGHGRRVYANTVGSGHILSQYAIDGKLLYQENHKLGKRIDYIYLGTRLVAQRERPLASSTATLKYQHTDALGSPLAVTNPSKVTIETSEYEPYGQLVNKPLFDGPGYTGHAQDAATGLTYMQQRYYDPQIGRFLSVDPVTAYTNPGRNFNRYWYANDNPYRFNDPDGRIANFVVKGVIDFALEVGIQYATTGTVDIGDALLETGKGMLNPMKSIERAGDLRRILNSSDKGLHRPYIRRNVRDEVNNRAPRSPEGKPLDPNTGKPIEGKPDLGHKPGHEFRTEKINAEAQGMNQKDFNNNMNNPDKYQLEDPSSNRSHRYEKK